MSKPQSEAAMFHDLCVHARNKAREAVMQVALLAPHEMAAGVIMDAAQDMAVLGALTFVASTPVGRAANIDAGLGLHDPTVCEAFRIICKAWSLAPDQAAAEKVMVEGLTNLGGMNLKAM